MADAVFTACFLNMANRNSDIIGMANYAPAVNTRGLIFTHKTGIVLRSTYHVFDMYVNKLGDTVLDTYVSDIPVLNFRNKEGNIVETPALDLLVTLDKDGLIALAAVNKDPVNKQSLRLAWSKEGIPNRCAIQTLSGSNPDSYNDIDRNDAVPNEALVREYKAEDEIGLPPHSVSIVKFS